MFIGEKPSLFFVRHPEERSKGNHNAVAADFMFHNWIRMFFKKSVYVTDMVKTEGRGGTSLREWGKNPVFRKLLQNEITRLKPRVIVVMSRKVEELLTDDPVFSEYKNRILSIYPPSYVARYNKFNEWDAQFKKILKKL